MVISFVKAYSTLAIVHRAVVLLLVAGLSLLNSGMADWCVV